MNVLPLPYVRTAITTLSTMEEAFPTFFIGTGISHDQLFRPDFEMSAGELWTVLDNISGIMGDGWYYHVPALWSSDIQGDMEAAMRAAPNLAECVNIPALYGSVRMPLLRWAILSHPGTMRIDCMRSQPIPDEHWPMFGVIVLLNFQTIIESAYPGLSQFLSHEIMGPCPIDESVALGLFRGSVKWNAPRFASSMPSEQMGRLSMLSDPRMFSSLTRALADEREHIPDCWSDRVSHLLEAVQGRRPTCAEVAKSFGLSLRTLERNLAQENTSFRELTDTVLKVRILRKLSSRNISLAEVAVRLGYSDESALSRASRRLFGQSAAALRKEARQAADTALIV